MDSHVCKTIKPTLGLANRGRSTGRKSMTLHLQSEMFIATDQGRFCNREDLYKAASYLPRDSSTAMLPAEVPTAIRAALPEGLNGWGCTDMTPLVIPFLLLSTVLQQTNRLTRYSAFQSTPLNALHAFPIAQPCFLIMLTSASE